MKTRQKVYDFIVMYFEEHGYAPSYKEIGDGVSLRSKSSVYEHVQRLIDDGLLETDAEPGTPRAIRVPGYRFERINNED